MDRYFVVSCVYMVEVDQPPVREAEIHCHAVRAAAHRRKPGKHIPCIVFVVVDEHSPLRVVQEHKVLVCHVVVEREDLRHVGLIHGLLDAGGNVLGIAFVRIKRGRKPPLENVARADRARIVVDQLHLSGRFVADLPMNRDSVEARRRAAVLQRDR